MRTAEWRFEATVTRLDEHRIRVQGQGPADAEVWGNGWETEARADGTFAFNCMAYTDGTVRLRVVAEGAHRMAIASVTSLEVGATATARPEVPEGLPSD